MKDRIALGEMAQKKNVSYMESLPLTAGNVTVRKKNKAECLCFLADGGGGAVDSDPATPAVFYGGDVGKSISHPMTALCRGHSGLEKSAAQRHHCYRNTATALFIEHSVALKCNSSSLLLKLADMKSRLVGAEIRIEWNRIDYNNLY